jgi:serine protease AprX
MYQFAPVVDASQLAGLIDLSISFKEKSLNQAVVQVYQSSAGIWHPFEIDTSLSDDQEISALFDLTTVLESPQDLADLKVRFVASHDKSSEKAEVNFIALRVADLVGDTSSVLTSSEAINAAPVWLQGNLGSGIGVAVIDSGVKRYHELQNDSQGNKSGLEKGWSALTEKDVNNDRNGHGTLVASIISNQKRNGNGIYHGIAPDSVIIPVEVLDKDGRGSYSDIIAGLDWVVQNKDLYNIRVVNLSLSAPVQSYYWDDPLNQAVMRAWQADIVIVAAAGNGGPAPMTIGVPGNNPYVITVGALTDAYTTTDWSDDYVPAFSASGPTYEGFVKPDVIAPGGHIAGLMSDKCTLAKVHPEFKIDKDYYHLSGTSMSAAQVSGVVALMLAENPALTPDEVKYRLMASAQPATNAVGEPAYSLWQQGAGRVNAYQAVYGDASGTANQGLDIAADLAGTRHFGGYTRWNPEMGAFYLISPDGAALDDRTTWAGGYSWSVGHSWSVGYSWSVG